MAPINKAQAAGVSSSSFLELKTQVEKQKEIYAKDKATGNTSVIVGRKKNGKKPSKWELPNKGVHNRAVRDIEQEAVDRRTVESSRIYEKLKKGQFGGLSEVQYGELLVDFDSKPDDPYESDSDDLDESLTDDPIIEFEDEFGRVRSARRSEVPRHLLPHQEKGEDENPVNFFPVYEPSADRVAAIKAAAAEENNPLDKHYDASREVRAKGAGFYQFSADNEEARKKQMEELRQAREETERTRQERGAVDLRAGEAEGMQADASTLQSRAIEKRKKDLEERRKAVEVKRRKLQNGGNSSAAPTPSPAPTSEPAGAVPNKKAAPNPDPAPSAADSFLAALELDLAMNRR
ncbi:hypothetical protein EDB87DRAFT_1742597 [Lactarius vividus]|nr:hypothetical protein EDB87DRAFT_1742597 [Lactarius vividus]